MKLGRVLFGEQTRAAVIEQDVVRVLGAGIDTIDLLSADPEQRQLPHRGRDRAERGCAAGPVKPPTMRDFSVFEQHIEGVIQAVTATRARLGAGALRAPGRLQRLLQEPRDADVNGGVVPDGSGAA